MAAQEEESKINPSNGLRLIRGQRQLYVAEIEFGRKMTLIRRTPKDAMIVTSLNTNESVQNDTEYHD